LIPLNSPVTGVLPWCAAEEGGGEFVAVVAHDAGAGFGEALHGAAANAFLRFLGRGFNCGHVEAFSLMRKTLAVFAVAHSGRFWRIFLDPARRQCFPHRERRDLRYTNSASAEAARG
jgi:hypothetical protein